MIIDNKGKLFGKINIVFMEGRVHMPNIKASKKAVKVIAKKTEKNFFIIVITSIRYMF